MQILMIGESGAGKGYEAVRYQILPALEEGRLVVTNMPLVVEEFAKLNPTFPALIELRKKALPIRGKWDPEREEGAFELFPDGREQERQKGARRFSSAWDFYHDWRHPKTGQGPLFIVDEAQLSVPKDSALDKSLFEWQTLHRHFGCDVIWMTQDYKSLNRGFLGNVQFSYWMHKKTAWGEPDRYIKKVRTKLKGAVMNEAERSYESQYFPLWRSHTQGVAVKEFGGTDIKPWRNHWTKRGARWAFGIAAVMLVWAAWQAFGKEKPPPQAKVKRPDPVSAVINQSVPGMPKEAAGPSQVPREPAPFDGLGVHVLGSLRQGGRIGYLLGLSQQAQMIRHIASWELETAGYEVEPISDCVMRLTWKGAAQFVRCDSPSESLRLGGAPSSTPPRDAGSGGGVPPPGGGAPAAPGSNSGAGGMPSESGPTGTVIPSDGKTWGGIPAQRTWGGIKPMT